MEVISYNRISSESKSESNGECNDECNRDADQEIQNESKHFAKKGVWQVRLRVRELLVADFESSAIALHTSLCTGFFVRGIQYDITI